MARPIGPSVGVGVERWEEELIAHVLAADEKSAHLEPGTNGMNRSATASAVRGHEVETDRATRDTSVHNAVDELLITIPAQHRDEVNVAARTDVPAALLPAT